MKAYFHDQTHGNLIYNPTAVPICETEWVHRFNPNWHIFKSAGFTPTFEKTKDGPIVYYVGVRNRPEFWCGLTAPGKDSPSPKHILEYIDSDILNLAKQRKLVIILDNQAEGNSMVKNGFDAYAKNHFVMKLLGLPPYTLLIVDSNKNFVTEYESWCIVNREPPMIAHSYALTGFYYFDRYNKVPTKPLIYDAMKNENSVDFNSLNRTARIHRLEHLYYLIKHNLHKNNLVSGVGVNREDKREVDWATFPTIISTPVTEFVSTLNKHLPLSVDGHWAAKNPDHSEEAIFNHNVYKNSLLSFVTETEMADHGLFITEKTFKPIVAGHPFILLAQPGALEYVRELGYKVDFYGIDNSYDTIKNPRERFLEVHKQLLRWVHMSRQEKLECLTKSFDSIEHNLEHFKNKNYVLDSYVNMRKTLEAIFNNTYRNFYTDTNI